MNKWIIIGIILISSSRSVHLYTLTMVCDDKSSRADAKHQTVERCHRSCSLDGPVLSDGDHPTSHRNVHRTVVTSDGTIRSPATRSITATLLTSGFDVVIGRDACDHNDNAITPTTPVTRRHQHVSGAANGEQRAEKWDERSWQRQSDKTSRAERGVGGRGAETERWAGCICLSWPLKPVIYCSVCTLQSSVQ